MDVFAYRFESERYAEREKVGKLIKVPYVGQPKNSPKCGAACASMVIKYYKSETVNLDIIWQHISAISPELKREYCRTYKIGAYIASNHFPCCTVRYSSLSKLLDYCNSCEIAPIINHKSFENNIVGHFSVIKNVFGNRVILNDPENKKRVVVPLKKLEKSAEKISPADEVGGNVAIVPILDKFSLSSIPCPFCGSNIDMSFSVAANEAEKIVDQNLCQSCDKFV